MSHQGVAWSIVQSGAVGFNFIELIKFSSGIQSPMYIDLRRLMFHPGAWKQVVRVLNERLETLEMTHLKVPHGRPVGFQPVVLGGIETAGIPHAAAMVMASAFVRPMVIIRKKKKDHGKKKMIEDGDVSGKEVVLVEDATTTGSAIIHAANCLRDEGATVRHCLAIATYNFKRMQENLSEAGIILHALTTASELVDEVVSDAVRIFSPDEEKILAEFFKDPYAFTDWVSER